MHEMNPSAQAKPATDVAASAYTAACPTTTNKTTLRSANNNKAFAARIYEFIGDKSEPWRPSPPWDFLRPDPSCRRIVDWGQLREKLLSTFSIDDLWRAGVLKKRCDGAPVFHPGLSDNRVALVIRNKNGCALDIVTPERSARTLRGDIPLFAIWRDAETQRFARNREKLVLAADNFEDVCLLRACNLAAAPTWLLDQLSYAGVQLLRLLNGASCDVKTVRARLKGYPEYFDDSDPHENAPTRLNTFGLAFLVSSPFGNGDDETRDRLRKVLGHFKAIEDQLEIYWTNFVVWAPDNALDIAGFFSRLRSEVPIRRLLGRGHFLFSLPKFDLETWRPTTSQSPADLATARKNLQRNIAERRMHIGPQTRVLDSYTALEGVIDDIIVAPIVRDAKALPSEADRAVEVVRAEILRAVATRLAFLEPPMQAGSAAQEAEDAARQAQILKSASALVRQFRQLQRKCSFARSS